MSLTFTGSPGIVWLHAGHPRPTTVTQDQCDRFAALFFETGMTREANSLWAAMKAAGFVPWASRRAA